MQLVPAQQMSRGLTMVVQRLRRLIAKLASGFNAVYHAIDDGKRMMATHEHLIRRGDRW
jgi:hypothetical protein